MTFDERITNVAVVGAAGKMGSGISLLLAAELAKTRLKPENRGRKFRLNLIDVSDDALDGLLVYLRQQLLKIAEKMAVQLREAYRDREDLVENYEILPQFVEDTLSLVRLGTDLNLARHANAVFEAVLEVKDLKVGIYRQLRAICPEDVFFLTNTSSIPIHVLSDEANLGGRILGFHFYNPPAVQKLAELIVPERTLPELQDFARELADRLRKKVVPANDIAGFIGNGHFLRDGLYALREAQRLAGEFGLPGAIYLVNKVSQDLLVRPMGIFQLLDYVGVDVFQCISETMDHYIDGEDLRDGLVKSYFDRKVLGGQRSDGSQKDGFLKYDRNRPVGVYDPAAGEYRVLDPQGWSGELDRRLGAYPAGFCPWKQLMASPTKGEQLESFFRNLRASDTLGARLALAYLKNSKEIGEMLVRTGVAFRAEDVNDVLLNGFFHLYGPINEYI